MNDERANGADLLRLLQHGYRREDLPTGLTKDGVQRLLSAPPPAKTHPNNGEKPKDAEAMLPSWLNEKTIDEIGTLSLLRLDFRLRMTDMLRGLRSVCRKSAQACRWLGARARALPGHIWRLFQASVAPLWPAMPQHVEKDVPELDPSHSPERLTQAFNTIREVLVNQETALRKATFLTRIAVMLAIGLVLLLIAGAPNRYYMTSVSNRTYKIDKWTGRAWLVFGDEMVKVKKYKEPRD